MLNVLNLGHSILIEIVVKLTDEKMGAVKSIDVVIDFVNLLIKK
jgi:hypothetical protein